MAYRETPEDVRLAAAVAAERERARVVSMCEEVREDLSRETVRCGQLHEEYASELRDVKRYEKGVLAAVYKLVADGDEKLAKEKAEALEAETHLHEAERSREELRLQLERLVARGQQLAHAEEELAAARAAMLATLDGTPAGHDVAALNAALGAARAELKEVDDAINAGDVLSDRVTQLLGKLDTSRGEGRADVIADGAVRMLQLGLVKEHGPSIRQALADFGRELRALGIEIDAELHLPPARDSVRGIFERPDFDEHSRIFGELLGTVGGRLGSLRRRRTEVFTRIGDLEHERERTLGG